MNRAYIKDLGAHIGEEVLIKGWVDSRRDHGKLIFLDVRDGGGKVQVVILPGDPSATDEAGRAGHQSNAHELRDEWTIELAALVKERPAKMVNENELNGHIELEAKALTVITKAEELPFDNKAELNLETHLDYLPLTLRRERTRDIFKIQACILQAYRNSLISQNFTEFVSPAIVGGDAEGGSAVFALDYFADHKAYLATSPQFYKQIMVGAFERVFTVAKVFRAEKSATSRHISEITQMDFEMGFIQNELEPIAVLEQIMKNVCKSVIDNHGDILERMGIATPKTPNKFPIFTLLEVQEILEKNFNVKCIGEDDMAPEHERMICEWALKEFNSDFVFITKFPTKARAFYTYEDPKEAPLSRGFDLLFRGLEINSGAQRINDYDQLIDKIKSKGLRPELFAYYLQAFKYGMPPHGGSSTGLERFTGRMLGLANIKESTAFPRDMNRIDSLLSRADE